MVGNVKNIVNFKESYKLKVLNFNEYILRWTNLGKTY